MKKLFSLAMVTGMLLLMSFSSTRVNLKHPTNVSLNQKMHLSSTKTNLKPDDKIYTDCFEAANGAEIISCGSEHCNDGRRWFVYNMCLMTQAE